MDSTPTPLPVAAGLEFLREIARGGMATVYEARDPARGVVAIKVLESRDPLEVVRFQAEQRLAARVDSSAVVPIHAQLTTEDGRAACSMELIRGVTLEDLLARGEVTTDRALAIVASTARALDRVHAARIVHRDVKPANLLVEPEGRVRLLDFGVALDLDEAPDQEATGEIVGTPRYFSPEQAQGLETGPATDTWALGVVLYELLTGAAPFASSNFSRLVFDLVTRTPRRPRSLNPAIGPEVERIVLRCLEKRPEDRFESAGDLARALAARLGVPVATALAPVAVDLARPAPPAVPPKPSRDQASLHYRVDVDLAATPERLWPLVSNTEKFNKAIGLPAVTFRDEPAAGGVRRTGRFRRLGMSVEWTEHPFEWVAPERQSVLRVHHKGPLEALWSEVRLARRADGGTALAHEVWLSPRGTIGRLAVGFEMSRTMRRIEEAYRRLDHHAVTSAVAAPDDRRRAEDAYAQAVALPAGSEAALAGGLDSLRASGEDWTGLVALLENELRAAPDFEAGRIRPYALAKRWRASRRSVLRLCLAAARRGLLEVAWHLLCPICRVPTRALGSLAELKGQNHCAACDVSYENDLASSVELAFRPSPRIRPVSDATYCLGGPGHYTHVVAQQELEPGETRRISVALAPGAWRITARGVQPGWDLTAARDGAAATVDVERTQRLTPTPGGVPVGATPVTGPIEVVVEEASLRPGPDVVPSGPVELVLRNESSARRLVRVEDAAWRADVLTALEACADVEVLSVCGRALPGEPIHVTRATYVAIGLTPGHDGLVQRAAAIVAERGGAPGSGATLGAFHDAAQAVEAALQLRELAHDGVRVRVAVHAGAALVSAGADTLDHHGPAPDLARRLLEGCQPGEVALTHATLGDPNVEPLVAGHATRVQRRRVGSRESLGVVYLVPA